MLKPEQIPNEVWTELALRLESCGAVVSDQVARLAACVVINAWPGIKCAAAMQMYGYCPDMPARIILPLTDKTNE